MKEKLSIIAFFTMLTGFAVLVASSAIPSEKMGMAALLIILPSITLHIAMRWINIGNVEYFIKNLKQRVSIITFAAMLIGFVILVASVALTSEKMGITALLLILPSITLNVAMGWINIGDEEYSIKDKS